MPPRKARKVKKEDYAPAAAAAKSSPSPPQTPKPEDEEPLSPLPSDATIETIPTDASEDGHTTDGSVDPALLDEEDAPGADELLKDAKEKGKGKKSWAGYNELKSWQGQTYSGMSVGSSHTWNYDAGVWKETKKEPDLWEIDYKVHKRRARNAPKGSGAPVGTQYHWLIVAHQYVEKIDANTYTTHLTGHKYKLAHKGANSASWSIPTVKGQRAREVELLEDAKRRVLDLPPVLPSQKVREEPKLGKGQQTLEGMFRASPAKRKVEDRE